MPRRSKAPYWITTHYGGRCNNPDCRRGIKKGETALYFPATRTLLCSWEPCGPRADEEMKAKRIAQAMYSYNPA